ncbi:hypothetical protein GTY75_17730 [Streptomyces sp. SID8381]|uniref:DUF6415 family natural product biosynthesis protein n=1 Tax=unclassified Streptomyces TaxID=2593676 RepID=UPI00037A9CE6|nr:DUF6415 family natural product biosynthesis protein [Streptomyces sp. Amel2xE9]MYX28462.1 hypothetical protein [Streptomyces sp. SID8381]
MNTTDTSPAPRIIVAAFDAGQRMPSREDLVTLDEQLRDELARLAGLARGAALTVPARSRAWYALTAAIDAAEDADRLVMGNGPLTAALHVAELARRALGLRDALEVTQQ